MMIPFRNLVGSYLFEEDSLFLTSMTWPVSRVSHVIRVIRSFRREDRYDEWIRERSESEYQS